MKLVTFRVGSKDRLGAIYGEWIVDIGKGVSLAGKPQVLRKISRRPWFKQVVRPVLAGGPAPRDMVSMLARGEAWLKALGPFLDALTNSFGPERAPEGLLTPLARAHLRAPILRPGKIVCVGRNYAEHARERGSEIPTQPIFFLKSVNAICGPGQAIVLPPNSNQVDYEAEFAVVLGKVGRRISEEKAYDYVAGYTILNDVSARDMQLADNQWYRGKSCDTFAPTGPWIVTRDEIPDPHNLRISLTLNGQTMQDSNTSNLIFNVPYLVSYLSQSLTWEPGDLISTGTPPGVGVSRKPPVFLKAGDSVSITVERIGTLTNPVTSG